MEGGRKEKEGEREREREAGLKQRSGMISGYDPVNRSTPHR